MQALTTPADSARYAKTIEASKRVRWDIDLDVIRGREFDLAQKFMPDGLSLVDELKFLSHDEQRFLGQVQGRTYANMFALVERFIGAKMLEISRDHWLGDQTALEAIVRLTDEELKHQELFRRIEALAGSRMPPGYRFDVSPNDVAGFVLGKCTWAVLALTCDIELTTCHRCSRMCSCSTGRRNLSTRRSTNWNGLGKTASWPRTPNETPRSQT
jgi:hypothetical protein